VHPTGVAVSSVKRDLESEKEAKKKGIGAPGLGGDGEDLVKGKEKTPKMKRIMVRKR
jgi:signal recognition particle subunit SRP19